MRLCEVVKANFTGIAIDNTVGMFPVCFCQPELSYLPFFSFGLNLVCLLNFTLAFLMKFCYAVQVASLKQLKCAAILVASGGRMPFPKIKASSAADANNDSLDTYITQAIGKEPLLSFSKANDAPVQLFQLLHSLDQGTGNVYVISKFSDSDIAEAEFRNCFSQS